MHLSTPKRFLFAFVSLLLAVTTLISLYDIPIAIKYGPRQAMLQFEILPVWLMVAFPGLLLAAPWVVFFRDAFGLRLWWILGIGTLIGPAVILGLAMLESHGQLEWRRNAGAVGLSAMIGILTTLYYVSFLRAFGSKIAADADAP